MLDELEQIDIMYLRQLPQFMNLTDEEIRIIAYRIRKEENRQWEEQRALQVQRERDATRAYMEEHSQDKVLPPEPVVIKQGIIISPSAVDDKGFASHDDLMGQKRTIKMSLEGTAKKIYL